MMRVKLYPVLNEKDREFIFMILIFLLYYHVGKKILLMYNYYYNSNYEVPSPKSPNFPAIGVILLVWLALPEEDSY